MRNPPEKVKKMLYAAYGSNMNIEQMKRRCPTAKVIGTAILEDYELAFCRVATVKPKRYAEVPIVLWDIKKEDERSLDLYEGWPRMYRKEYFKMDIDGKPCLVMIYLMNNDKYLDLPYEGYFKTILDGYVANNIEIGYLYEAYENALDEYEARFEEMEISK